MEKKTGELTVKPENKVEKTPIVPTKKAEKEVTVFATFRENRKYDLHIGRRVIVFTARETKEIPESFLNHSDWAQASKLFVIRRKGEKE